MLTPCNRSLYKRSPIRENHISLLMSLRSLVFSTLCLSYNVTEYGRLSAETAKTEVPISHDKYNKEPSLASLQTCNRIRLGQDVNQR